MNILFSTREEYENYKYLYLDLKAEEIIQGLINLIILSFYQLDKEVGFKADRRRIPKEIWEEAINWGDLSCVKVEKIRNSYVAYVEEADDTCIHLQLFIEDWLKNWGWDVKVKTEW